jgi:hypothetical protein
MFATSLFLSTPNPEVALLCGSMSHSSTFTPVSVRAAQRLTQVVVLPTPPFWLATAIIFPILLFPSLGKDELRLLYSICVSFFNSFSFFLFHVKHYECGQVLYSQKNRLETSTVTD